MCFLCLNGYDMSENYYTILGVEKSASEKEVKTAFRALAHKHHPDKGGDEKKFKEINEAYQTLSNKEKRKQYDTFGSAGQQYGGFNRNYSDFARSGTGSQFNIFSLKKVSMWVWLLLLPIIIIIALVGLVAVFLWISFRTLQTVRR